MTDGSSGLSSKALRVEQARIGRFLESMAKHRKALELAIEEGFGGTLDPAEWRKTFESAEPQDANRTMVVGLLPCRRPHAAQTFEALAEDGCLTADQAAELNVAYAIEGRLEHASPDVDAGEVLEAIERLRKALPGLIEAVLAWLERHGVRLDEQR